MIPDAVTSWFASQGWKPFPFQEDTWQAYQNGESGLIHAATGTGKTYAAYLGPLIEAVRKQERKAETLRVLWITPLRALASDTAMSLEAPFQGFGLSWKVETRTADTSASIRAKQRKRLPPVLVTTPESLSLFLTREDAPSLFQDLQAVIADEWHELLSSKRGVQTELALARLRCWHPKLRVWGLSATLGNLDVAMQVLLGPNRSGRMIHGRFPKQTVIDSVIPDPVEHFPWAGHLGLRLLPQVVAAIEEGHSALVFTNTRAQTETWYQAILQAKPDWAGLIALHHGSLDRKVRDWVEEQLREGKLRCVVCTSSLDLGVDFSPVDRVIQIGSPKGVARLLQRAGRSGHQPGGVSRVTCVPTNTLELLEVAAAKQAIVAGQIEGREPLGKPLDVLAQHVVTISMAGGFVSEELLEEVRTTYSYATLSLEEWNWVLDFVTRGGETLQKYPDFHRVILEDGRYRIANERVARRHRMAIGTIVSEAAMQVRFLRGGKLGSIEENFATRLRPGDCFVFAGRILELVRIHEMTVWVRLAKRMTHVIPRWVGGRMPLSSELALAVRQQFQQVTDGRIDTPELQAVLPILDLQRRWSILPKPHELLIERLTSREGYHLFFYPLEGRLVHEGLSALLAYRLSQIQPISFTLAINDYGFELLSPDPAPLEQALAQDLLSPDCLAEDILATMNAGELARRQFREIARVAGLVQTGFPGASKSAKQIQASSGLLYDVFREYDPNNLLLQQARREVLDRQLEQNRAKLALQRLQSCTIRLVDIPRPTPFAFPLLVERLRETISSEKLADRVRRMILELETSAGIGTGIRK